MSWAEPLGAQRPAKSAEKSNRYLALGPPQGASS
jgi:hypothetical protein